LKKRKYTLRVLLARFKAIIAVRLDECVILVDAPLNILETIDWLVNSNREYIVLKAGRREQDYGETYCYNLPTEPGLYAVLVSLVGEDFKNESEYGIKFVVQSFKCIRSFSAEQVTELDFDKCQLDDPPYRWGEKSARRITAKEFTRLVSPVDTATGLC